MTGLPIQLGGLTDSLPFFFGGESSIGSSGAGRGPGACESMTLYRLRYGVCVLEAHRTLLSNTNFWNLFKLSLMFRVRFHAARQTSHFFFFHHLLGLVPGIWRRKLLDRHIHTYRFSC